MDHAVGFQCVNRAIDNNDALKDLYDVKHALGVNGQDPYRQPTRAIGRHDDILIARTVVTFEVDSTTLVPTLRPVVSGPVLGDLFYTRIAAGQWRIYMASAQLVGVAASMKASAAVDYKADCYVSYDPSTGPAVTVTTWDVSTATLDDLPFSLAIWTQTS